MQKDTQHIAALDGLRGVAAMIVVFSHFSGLTGWLGHWPNHEAAHIGVMIFFCLSGFLMGHLNFAKAPTLPNIGVFFKRRAARILPLYLLIVLASYALYTSALPWQYRIYPVSPDNIWHHLFIIEGVNVLWTIPVEMQFYVLFPLFWIASGITGKCRWIVPLACLVAYCLSPLTLWHATNLPVFQNVFGFFLAGLLAAALMPYAGTLPKWFWNAVFLLCGVCVFCLYPKIFTALTGQMKDFSPAAISYHIYNSAIYLAIASLLVFSAANSLLAKRLLGNKPLVWLGSVSFSLYLLHMPVLWTLNRFTGIGESPWLLLAVALPLIFAVSHLSFRFIESPARQAISGFRLPRYVKV